MKSIWEISYKVKPENFLQVVSGRDLFEAVKDNDGYRARALLQIHPNLINCLDGNRNSALHWAAGKNHLDMVELLLGVHGVQPNAVNNQGRTPAQEACFRGYPEIARLVRGEVSARMLREGQNLIQAAKDDNYSVALTLLGDSPDLINYVDANNNSALHYAAGNNHIEMVELLLQVPGIHRDEINSYGRAPAEEGEYRGHRDIARIVRGEITASVLKAERNLIQACQNNDLNEVRILLTCYPEIINCTDHNNNTVLHWAASKNHQEIVVFLLSSPGINCNKSNNQGRTPAQEGDFMQHFEIARFIRGEITEVMFKEGKNLIQAIADHNFHHVQLLLSNYPQLINYYDHNQDSALHWAALKGYINIVNLLLSIPGVNCRIVNCLGRNAAQEAIIFGKHDVAEHIQNFMEGIDIDRPSTPILSFGGGARVVKPLTNQQKLDSTTCEHVPSDLQDHILLEIFDNPVTLPSGFSIERANILKMGSNAQGEISCPMTREKYNREKILKIGTNWMLKELANVYVKQMQEHARPIEISPSEEDDLLYLVNLIKTNEILNTAFFKDLNSGQTIIDPVTLSSGHTLDRLTIDKLSQGRKDFLCPKTKKILHSAEEKARHSNWTWKRLIEVFLKNEKQAEHSYHYPEEAKNKVTGINHVSSLQTSTGSFGIFAPAHICINPRVEDIDAKISQNLRSTLR